MVTKKTSSSAAKKSNESVGAGIVVLQWLTYAFWGWTLLSVSWLIYLVFSNMLSGSDTSGIIPYAIAGAFVLLPLSFLCDFFYSRHEQPKKTGVSMVVMVIHAVIFAMFGIGALIVAVFQLVDLTVSTPDNLMSTMASIYTFVVVFLLYGLTFLRTLNLLPKLRIAYFYKFIMLVVIGVFVVLAFVGPVAKSWATRDDRDIATNLQYVYDGVANHVRSNGELPASLQDIQIFEGGQGIVDRGLVTYKNDGKSPASESDPMYKTTSPNGELMDYKFQLCVTYKEKSAQNRTSRPHTNSKDYLPYVETAYHAAGEHCYKLKVVN